MAVVGERGYEALGTATSPCASKGLIGFDLEKDRLSGKVPTNFFRSEDPVFVIVCAMICQIDRCRREYDKTRIINVQNTLRLMEDAADLGAMPVYLTSSFVFDGKAVIYGEDDPHSPISEYGRQKAAIETYCRGKHPEWFLARLDKIVGDNPSEHHLFSEWRKNVRMRDPIICMAKQVFTPTYVNDIANAIVLGCRLGLKGLFNVAAGEHFSRESLARLFLQMLGEQLPVVCKTQEELGFSDLRPERSCLDSSRFRNATGMSFTSMREVISRFLAKCDRDGENVVDGS